MKKKYLLFNCIITVCFVLFVLFNFISKDKAYSEVENRYLSGKPQLSFENIKNRTFMTKAEDYSNDQLIYRDFFIKSKAVTEHIIGKKENNGVYFSKDDYLIEKPAPMDMELIEKNINAIKSFSDIKRFNVSVCIIPQAFEIHKDKLPDGVYRNVIARLTKTVNDGLDGGKIKNVDVTKNLSERKGDYIFYRTDHHQTSLGSFIVYEALGKSLGYEPLKTDDFSVETVSDDFYGTTYSKGLTATKADEICIYKTKNTDEATVNFVVENKGGDSMFFSEHLKKKDKYSYFLDGNHGITVVNTKNSEDKNLAIFKDSYAHSLTPFLANHYKSIHLIDMRYFSEDPIEYLTKNEITDILFLYGSSTFMTDDTIEKIGYYSENSPYANFGMVKECERVDNEYFSDAVFMGDSLMLGFQSYAGLPKAAYLCRTSLSVMGVYNTEDDGRSLIDKVKDTNPKKIYVMLGANELITMSNKDAVMDKYSAVIDTLKQDNPEAIIYMHSIFPVTREKESSSIAKNDVIRSYNESILKVCEEKNVYFVDVQSAVADKDGYLPENLSTDGVHLGSEGCKIWADYLKCHAIGGEPATAEAFSESDENKGSYDLLGVAKKIKEDATFEGDIGQTDRQTLVLMHGIDEEDVVTACGFVGGGATAEEITLIEAKSKKEAEIIKEKLSQYIEKRIKDFESYVPKEVPKLNSAVLICEENFVALVIASDTKNAENILTDVEK